MQAPTDYWLPTPSQKPIGNCINNIAVRVLMDSTCVAIRRRSNECRVARGRLSPTGGMRPTARANALFDLLYVVGGIPLSADGSKPQVSIRLQSRVQDCQVARVS